MKHPSRFLFHVPTRINNFSLVLTALMALSTPPAAQAINAPSLEVHGYGTGGFGTTTGQYTDVYSSSNGTRNDFTLLSRLGVNLRADLDMDWELKAEIEMRGDRNEFGSFLNWGFLSYRADDWLALRGGRLITPYWLYSQQIDVGFSYPWTYLPAEVYGLTGSIKSLSGLSALSTVKLARGIWQTEIQVGEGTNKITDVGAPFAKTKSTYTAQQNDALAIETTYEFDHFLLGRVGYAQSQLQLQANTRTTSSTTPMVITEVVSGLDVGFTRLFSLGVKYDRKGIFASSEWVKRTIQGTAFPTASAFYVMGGFDLGRWSPHYTYSAAYALEGTANVHPDLTKSTLQLSGETHMVGLNFHPSESVVLKSSFSYVTEQFANSSENLKFNRYQLTADFVF